MHVLTRIISQYDGPNLFLGVFRSEEKAYKAREEYLKNVATYDPLASQTYRKADLGADIQIVEIEDHRDYHVDIDVGYLVIANFEGMGQVSRRFLAFFSDRGSASEFAWKAEQGPYETAPNWCDVDEVMLDVPR